MSKNKKGNLPALIEGDCRELLFDSEHHIRTVFHDGKEWFCVVDLISSAVQSARPSQYWSDTKAKDPQLYDFLVQLKFTAKDGKQYLMDAADAVGLLRIVQSIASPKVEHVKRWLANVGYERILEDQNPELAIKRGMLRYRELGYDDAWIEKRMKGMQVRHTYTDRLKESGITKGEDYAKLTNTVHTAAFGVNTQRHKELKDLNPKKDSLRDNMTPMELATIEFAESAATEASKANDAHGLAQNADAAIIGGSAAKAAAEVFEQKTGQRVLSRKNYKSSRKKLNN